MLSCKESNEPNKSMRARIAGDSAKLKESERTVTTRRIRKRTVELYFDREAPSKVPKNAYLFV